MNTNCFEIIKLHQGTDEWKEWRRNGIGASDAPTIMGENPYKNINQLVIEKRDPFKKSYENYSMALGNQLEPEARKRYIAKKGITVEPVCLQSSIHNWLRASLDGFNLQSKTVVEIKCGESVYRKTLATKYVPQYYYGQLQHILAITGFEDLDFFCYLPNRPELLLNVKRNNVYIERMLKKEYDFWENINKQS
jgi:putative phage-type endonuclease